MLPHLICSCLDPPPFLCSDLLILKRTRPLSPPPPPTCNPPVSEKVYRCTSPKDASPAPSKLLGSLGGLAPFQLCCSLLFSQPQAFDPPSVLSFPLHLPHPPGRAILMTRPLCLSYPFECPSLLCFAPFALRQRSYAFPQSQRPSLGK